MTIFDASTLILVTKAEVLDLFLTSVGTPAAIPVEIARECCSSKKTLEAALIQKALDESRIKTMVVKNRRLVEIYKQTSGSGRAKQRP